MRYGIGEGVYSAKLDTPKQILGFFNPAHSFIDNALDQGCNVMVHCLAGAHRAGTTGVSYMMKAGKMSYADALKVAKRQRSVVDPIGGLAESLRKLEWAHSQVGHVSSDDTPISNYAVLEIELSWKDTAGMIEFKLSDQSVTMNVPYFNPQGMRLLCFMKSESH